MLKRALFSLLLFCFSSLFPVYGGVQAVYWFLCASMLKPCREIVTNYNREQSKVEVTIITGGSGELLGRIRLSGKKGCYTPASEYFLRKAEDMKVVNSGEKLVSQTPVVAVSERGGRKIKSFDDLLNKKISIAAGNPGTMALGRTFQVIKERMPEKISRQITANESLHALNVNQIVNYLKLNAVDAGIMYNTTAIANGLKYIVLPSEYNITTYTFFSVINGTDNISAVNDFKAYLYEQSDIFKKYGFEIYGGK